MAPVDVEARKSELHQKSYTRTKVHAREIRQKASIHTNISTNTYKRAHTHIYTQFVLFVCRVLTSELPILVSNVNASQREIKTPFKQAAVP